RLLEEWFLRDREAEPPAPQWPLPRPDCPAITELMDVALGHAAPEVTERVRRHLPVCDYCRACVESYQTLLRDEEAPELPLAGSLLELVASGELKPKPRPAAGRPTPEEPVGPRHSAGTSMALDRSATQTGPTGFTALVRAGRLGDLEDRLRPW